MITNFKIFESDNKDEPEIGDYVLLVGFKNDTIGQIEDITNIKYDKPGVNWGRNNGLKYKVLPSGSSFFVTLYSDEIKYWSKNRGELEDILAAKKFNL